MYGTTDGHWIYDFVTAMSYTHSAFKKRFSTLLKNEYMQNNAEWQIGIGLLLKLPIPVSYSLEKNKNCLPSSVLFPVH